MSEKMSRAEAEAIVHDRARFTLEEHAAERSGGGLPYSDNAVREALAILSQPDTAWDEALEEAAKVADKYADAAGDYEFRTSKRKTSECIAAAIRALKSAPKPDRPEGVPEFVIITKFSSRSVGPWVFDDGEYRYRFDGVEGEK